MCKFENFQVPIFCRLLAICHFSDVSLPSVIFSMSPCLQSHFRCLPAFSHISDVSCLRSYSYVSLHSVIYPMSPCLQSYFRCLPAFGHIFDVSLPSVIFSMSPCLRSYFRCVPAFSHISDVSLPSVIFPMSPCFRSYFRCIPAFGHIFDVSLSSVIFPMSPCLHSNSVGPQESSCAEVGHITIFACNPHSWIYHAWTASEHRKLKYSSAIPKEVSLVYVCSSEHYNTTNSESNL